MTPTPVKVGTSAVAPSINIDHESVHVGDIINITGSGFGQDESGILVTFDGIAAGSNTMADDNGRWSVSIAMPACVNGVHTVAAHGNVTAATGVSNRTITVSAKIALSPASGNVGDTINVIGSGFSSGKKAVVTYGGVFMLEDVPVDSTGSFSDSFKAPGGKHGGVEVVATEADGISASSDFAMDTTPPSVPRVTSPTDGSMVGFIGDTKVNFDWTDVTDPSGVYYDLQIATDANFKDIVVQQSGLAVPEYKSTKAEALPHGEYYWRIRAVDGAGNTSDWTAPALLKAGFMSTTTLIIILVVVLLGVLAVVMRVACPKQLYRFLSYSHKNN
jgi:hypothetical protein